MSTVRELLGRSREYLERNGVPSPKLDAEYLLAHVLAVPRLELYLDHDRPLEPAEVDSLRELVRRRGKREPLAYVLGSWSFYGLELQCDARALVPRPETEVLVERCLALLADAAEPSVVDVGTGTGAIALALAARLPEASVTAIDLSPEALALAAENAALNGLADRVELLEGDLLAPGRRPPLRPRGLEPAVRRRGRDGGPRGRRLRAGTRRLRRARRDGPSTSASPQAALSALRPGGHLVVEVAEGQAPWLAEHLAGLGYTAIAVTRDLRGIERVVEAQAPS